MKRNQLNCRDAMNAGKDSGTVHVGFRVTNSSERPAECNSALQQSATLRYASRPVARCGSFAGALSLAALALFCATAVRAERVMSFTGSGTVTLANLSAFRFGASNDFALELWIKPANTGSELGAIVANDTFSALTSIGTNGGWGLFWQSGGLRVARKPSTSAVNTNMLGGNPGQLFSVTTSNWHHVVVNFKKVDKMTFYVDGVLKETSTDAFNSWAYFQRTFDSSEPIRIGAEASGTNNFKGAVDEVRVWSRVRTDAEILNAFQQRTALSGTEPGLVAYYKFDESSGPAASLGSVGGTGGATVSVGPARVDDPTLTLTGAPPPATDYAFSFNGVNQSIETQTTGDKLAGDELSIEYWFKGTKLHSAVRLQVGNRWVVSGWGPLFNQAPQHLINTTGTNALAIPITTVVPGVQDGNWHHVAMTWKRNTTQGFKGYLDGSGGGGVDTSNDPFPLLDGKVFIGSVNGTNEFLVGQLDEVRIWNRVLSDAEIRDHYTTPRRLLGQDPGLVAYFSFNDLSPTGTVDTVTKQLAVFRNMSSADRQVQDSINFREAALITASNPTGAGLWLGEISLKNVNEVFGGSVNTTNSAPAGGQFDFNVILHADSNGVVRLLKDVTIMQKRNTASNLTDLVLVTDDAQLANFDGVLKRSGKLVGVRFSSAFYQFDGPSLPMAGGVGYGFRMAGTNSVLASQATNPFRHRYHPQHKNPVDLQGRPYDITREIEISLTSGGKVAVSDGRDRLKGTYRETIRGLHKVPLITEGEISLERVSLVNKLNNQ